MPIEPIDTDMPLQHILPIADWRMVARRYTVRDGEERETRREDALRARLAAQRQATPPPPEPWRGTHFDFFA